MADGGAADGVGLPDGREGVATSACSDVDVTSG